MHSRTYSYWSRLHSTNVLERLKREVTRRTDVVSVFPDAQAVLHRPEVYPIGA